MTLTIPTLAWVLPLIGLTMWAYYRYVAMPLKRWVLRRHDEKIARIEREWTDRDDR